jgi:hypothetical protein
LLYLFHRWHQTPGDGGGRRCSLGWDLKQADQHLNPPRPSAYRRIDEVAKKATRKTPV